MSKKEESLFSGHSHIPSIAEQIGALAEKIFIAKLSGVYTLTRDQRLMHAEEAIQAAVTFLKVKKTIFNSQTFLKDVVLSDDL